MLLMTLLALTDRQEKVCAYAGFLLLFICIFWAIPNALEKSRKDKEERRGR